MTRPRLRQLWPQTSTNTQA